MLDSSLFHKYANLSSWKMHQHHSVVGPNASGCAVTRFLIRHQYISRQQTLLEPEWIAYIAQNYYYARRYMLQKK